MNDRTAVTASAAPTATTDGVTVPAEGRLRRWIRDDRSWLTMALVTTLLLGWGGEEGSPVGWLNPVVFAAALIVRSLDARRGPTRWRRRGWPAAFVMILVGWAVGMVIEMTITVDGGGFGGLHPDTVPSFILAQGYYIPAAVLTWAAVRRYGLDTRRAFYFAGTMAWWEAITLGAAAILSPFFVLAPLLIAYYFSTYALCGMAGLLVVDHVGIARREPRAISDRRLLGYGAIAGACSWIFFMGWATLASKLFDLSI